MENEKLLNDDVVLDKPDDSLKTVADNVETEVLGADSIKETEIVPEGEPKDLILNKEEYAEQLRKKLNPQNEVASSKAVEDAGLVVGPGPGIDLSTETPEQRRKRNSQNLKQKLQEILVQLEEMDEPEEPVIEESPVEIPEKAITEDGVASAPTAAGIAGPGTTTEGVAQYKEKIGNFKMFKRKSH